MSWLFAGPRWLPPSWPCCCRENLCFCAYRDRSLTTCASVLIVIAALPQALIGRARQHVSALLPSVGHVHRNLSQKTPRCIAL